MAPYIAGGRRANGQLGGASGGGTPRPVDANRDWQDVSAGGFSSAGVRAGRLYAWGYHLAPTVNAPAPVEMSSESGWAEVAADALHACARRAGGNLACWGWNSRGYVGDGTTTERPAPVDIAVGRRFTRVAGAMSAMYAIGEGGTLWAWGDNAGGQLGDGTAWSAAPAVLP